MAPTCKSAALMVMLVLAALAVSAQAGTQDVWIQNKTPTKCKCNGFEILPGAKILVKVDISIYLNLLIEVLGKDGKWVGDKCHVPRDVNGLALELKVNVGVVVKVVSCVGGLIHQLLGTLLGLILIIIKVIVVV